MAYEVTATRKRPKTFDGLVGQEFVVSTLQHALQSGRIAHAYLFAGPRGVGKTSAARILARALNNPGGPGFDASVDPAVLDDISRGRAIDVIEIDGASNTSVNDVRAIKDEVLFPPQNSRYKIYIIDEVHMLSNSAFNALLKTIEEPPPYIIFIFATTEIHKVPATIRSRCQQFNFRLISIDLIQAKLAEACTDMEIKADAEALFWIAKEGTGSLRDSYTLFDQVVSFSGDHISLGKIREKLGFVGLEQLGDLAKFAYEGNSKDALLALHGILDAGISIEQCIIDITEYYRGILFLQSGLTREALLGSSPDRFFQPAVKGYTRGQIERIIAMFLNLYRDVRYSLDPRCELELAIARLARFRLSLDSAEILDKLNALESHYLASKKVVSDDGIGANGSVVSERKSTTESTQPVPQIPTPVIEPLIAPKEEAQGSQEQIDAFKNLFIKSHPMVAGLLDSVSRFVINDTTLCLHFETMFSSVTAKSEIPVITECAKKIWPGITNVDLAVLPRKDQEGVKTEVDDPEVQPIKEIFRAEVVKMGNSNESI